jgi:hypothetical protein
MKSLKVKAIILASLIGSGVLLASQFAEPVVAEMRTLLVRNADNPALAPFRWSEDIGLDFINTQRLVTTVPVGKRLVLQNVSYWTFGPNTDQVIYVALRNGQLGPNTLNLGINPPHISASGALSIQDGSTPVTVYYDENEEVWLSVSKSGGSGRQFSVQLHGYFVTP